LKKEENETFGEGRGLIIAARAAGFLSAPATTTPAEKAAPFSPAIDSCRINFSAGVALVKFPSAAEHQLLIDDSSNSSTNSSRQPLHQQLSFPTVRTQDNSPLSSSNRAWSLPCNDDNGIFIIPAEISSNLPFPAAAMLSSSTQ
jgi:hypothetical protein